MNEGTDQKTGTLKFSDDVIAVCAVNATLKVDGVEELSGGLSDTLAKNFLGKDLLSKGIKVNQGEHGITIDISVVVAYNCKIPSVAWDIQESVKKEVESMTDTSVKAVNIYVQGVLFPLEDEEVL